MTAARSPARPRTGPGFGLLPGTSRVAAILTRTGEDADRTRLRLETTPPLRAGSRVAFTARFLGRDLAYTYDIADFAPAERLVMRTAQGPFPMETTYTWQTIDDNSTRMTLRNRGEPAGFSKLATPFMAMAMRRANRKDLRNLRSILETA
jgi:hypothetical protein